MPATNNSQREKPIDIKELSLCLRRKNFFHKYLRSISNTMKWPVRCIERIFTWSMNTSQDNYNVQKIYCKYLWRVFILNEQISWECPKIVKKHIQITFHLKWKDLHCNAISMRIKHSPHWFVLWFIHLFKNNKNRM